MLNDLIHRITVCPGVITIAFNTSGLNKRLKIGSCTVDDDRRLEITVPFHTRRRGRECKIVVEGDKQLSRLPDQRLVQLIGRCHDWWSLFKRGEVSSIRQLAERSGVHAADVTRHLPLAFLAPDIIEAIVRGRQPVELNVELLKKLSPIPANWNQQRLLLGFTA